MDGEFSIPDLFADAIVYTEAAPGLHRLLQLAGFRAAASEMPVSPSYSSLTFY